MVEQQQQVPQQPHHSQQLLQLIQLQAQEQEMDEQEEQEEQEEEETIPLVSEVVAGWTADVDLTHDDTPTAVVAEEIKPEGGHAGEEAEPDMEDATQSSADEAVGEAGPSGLLSI
tara:strand:+ start:3396 stop:3740 length:345 start_codon:yes stop_codon:yes gene_type:complete